jgi:hypothetical protein
MAKYTFVVLTNPVSGKEEEYNKWYNGQHIPDILNIPGFVGAQRFILADHQMGGAPAKHKYLALYEIETDDLAATINELRKRQGTPEIVSSDAIDTKDVVAVYFEPVTEKVMAKDVKRARRVA